MLTYHLSPITYHPSPITYPLPSRRCGATVSAAMPNIPDPKEQAYLYDLYVVPGWREVFDQMVDDEVKIPPEVLEEGIMLDAECGTGGYAVDLLLRGGQQAVVVGVDASEEKLALARGKAEIQKVERRVTFRHGTLAALGVAASAFDWLTADATLTAPEMLGAAFVELHRVAKPGATVALKLATRGSFGEFFSVLWETLYELELIEYTPRLETLITARPTVSDAEALAAAAGWKNVRFVTRKVLLEYASGAEFVSTPLLATAFLPEWLSFLPNQATRDRVLKHLPTVIDRARQALDFDVSLKATLILAQK